MSSSSANSTLCSAARESRSENGRNGNVLLATAVVQIKDRAGCYHIARALLDSASQLNLITANLAQKLRLQRQYIKADISGIGDVSSRVNFETWATVKSRINDYETDLNMWVLPSITGIQPESEISVSSWRIPSNLELADPKFYKPQAIDLLIGADKFFELLSVGQIKLGEDFPTLQKTLFGWIACGRYKVPEIVKQICNVSYVLEQSPVDDSLNNLVERFWNIENVNVKPPKLTEEQQRCEQLFLDSVRILENGRLMVKMPLKESPKILGNSVDTAKRRFLALERKLDKDPDLKKQYVEFMRDYESQGHMEIVPDKRIPPIHYYMPHHCVLRPESSSTKLRVVYDASCRTTSNISLNDILMIGPTVQNDLFSILLRFRCWKFALTADVSQMYRQILVYTIDTNLQCILWRENIQDELKTFRLKTVTYGTASAPYLATRCLNYLAEVNSQKYPLAEKIIKEDFYVDDLLTGADTLDEIRDIQMQLQTVLQTAALTLRKWYSNSSELLKNIPEKDREKPLRLNDSDIIKTLGIAWEPVSDTFRFTFKPFEQLSSKITKRVVLSDIARLFDPLGYVNPVVLRAKVFMQELWLLNLTWDESLPLEFYSRWQNFRRELHDLNTIAIPRRIMPDTQFYRTEIHGFADASIRAYGCCIYTRSVDNCGNVLVRLLTAKSKVAPTKTTRTLPCLELCGSELLAKVLIKVKDNLQKPISDVFLWTDSQIVLSWLASHASMWQTFVANRVSTIQELTANATWRHVPSKSNPADIISRGSSIADLKQSCWFTGPKFLYEPCECWPEKKEKLTDLPGMRKLKKILVCVVQQSFLDAIYKFSTFSKTRRVYAYVLRFIENLKRRRAKKVLVVGELCAQELENALLKLVWLIQHRVFSEEIQALEQGEMISPKGCLQSLNPFLDNQTLLRVGGRLQNADLPYNAKCPILLPKNNPFVKSYVNYLHFRHFHAGPQALIAIIRQQFWVVNIRDYARRIVKECIHCFRYRPRLMQQMMADLPKDRVVGSMAFMNAGVDFCGPIWTTHKIRGRRPYKSYIAVFICFLSKGVHLEVVSDLSSEAFILALKRFVSRRRLCRRLYCDNATNFVGARNQLKEFREQFLAQHAQKNIAQWCSEEAIEFHHIPPRAPHFGGIWEAAVKSAKSHLFRTLQNSLLTFEELTTVCSQIEATLNCRPICKLSSDPNDEEVLTPAHFWNQAPLNCFVEPNLTNEKMSHYVNRWRRISIIQQHFWRRWSAEYLSSLHNRYKWKFSTPNAVDGMVALIHDDNLPPQKWLLGRIIKAIPGEDGKVRVVDVKTRAGILRRAIHKLAPLPTTEDI